MTQPVMQCNHTGKKPQDMGIFKLQQSRFQCWCLRVLLFPAILMADLIPTFIALLYGLERLVFPVGLGFSSRILRQCYFKTAKDSRAVR
ncbi:hypothetical protein LZ32DRAFT_457852 [Colletotrichum eremochloae]|nr:hypothetical protein LZ32DRAFT_457852 [Colletotrichum eremochloae]